MTAVEALRRARATATHDHSGWIANPDCEGCLPARECSTWDLSVNGHEPMGTFTGWHERCASALLDGFSVDEVTAAEHTTEEPHEGYQIDVTDVESMERVHCNGCAASDAREDRLREALREIASMRCDFGEYPECGCPVCIARRALAAIPPRSDR